MYSKHDLRNVLESSGLKKGNILFVHSSMKKVDQIEGGPESIIDIILEIIGTEGMLAMPSFNYTWAIPEPYFDVENTPGRTGVLTEIFRKRKNTLRSYSPTHSVIAQGKNAEYFTKDHLLVESLGINSPIDKIAKSGGYVLLIGVSHTSNSTIHIGEAYAKVKKYFYKDGELPTARVLLPDGKIIDHQIDCSGSCGRVFNALEYPLRKKDKIIDLTIGKAASYLMKGADVIDATVEMITEQPAALFCNQPTCRRCVLGREYVSSKHN